MNDPRGPGRRLGGHKGRPEQRQGRNGRGHGRRSRSCARDSRPFTVPIGHPSSPLPRRSSAPPGRRATPAAGNGPATGAPCSKRRSTRSVSTGGEIRSGRGKGVEVDPLADPTAGGHLAGPSSDPQGDPIEPAGEAIAPPDRPRSPGQDDERRLEDVVGVVRVDEHSLGDPLDQRPVATDKLAERGWVSAGDERGQQDRVVGDSRPDMQADAGFHSASSAFRALQGTANPADVLPELARHPERRKRSLGLYLRRILHVGTETVTAIPVGISDAGFSHRMSISSLQEHINQCESEKTTKVEKPDTPILVVF